MIAHAEYAAGLVTLRRKVRRFEPEVVAFVGVSLFRVIYAKRGAIRLGQQAETFEGAKTFVLPNPSGRNANFSYLEMRRAFRKLAHMIGSTSVRRVRQVRRVRRVQGTD